VLQIALLTLALASGVPPGAALAPAPAADSTATGTEVVVLETVRGLIMIEVDETAAPRTAANFERLVQQRYFDGTYFHAVYPGFKIQAGDPNTRNADPADDGRGGPGYTIPAEIGLPCVRGAVVAARLPDVVNPERASSGSQFFILLADAPTLDRAGYTVFGRVVRGLDVADALARLGRLPDVPRGAAGPNPGHRAFIGRAYPSTRQLRRSPAPGD